MKKLLLLIAMATTTNAFASELLLFDHHGQNGSRIEVKHIIDDENPKLEHCTLKIGKKHAYMNFWTSGDYRALTGTYQNQPIAGLLYSVDQKEVHHFGKQHTAEETLMFEYDDALFTQLSKGKQVVFRTWSTFDLLGSGTSKIDLTGSAEGIKAYLECQEELKNR